MTHAGQSRIVPVEGVVQGKVCVGGPQAQSGQVVDGNFHPSGTILMNPSGYV